ncbi:hypothetical protein LUZ61_016131 [Rhynchospora tenuis]|uniref:Uncharacterized protein n=1 Tax=Rhynchospora tenuis TaxID=198213 RepID=A0AAD5Z4W8_9POAL|nr:hypothetical protein LUZ61_016131 [Rhynchospora tenuis]
MGRAPCCDKIGLKKGRWTEEEDEILVNFIEAHGEGSWRSLPKKAGLLRCGKSCRLRWINYLRTGLKRGNFSNGEEELIIKLHATLGNRWSQIASQLPGRTDNDIKNYWNSHLSRRIDSYPQVNSGRNTEVESVKSSQKNCEKNNNKKKTAQTATLKKKKTVVGKTLNPQHLFQHSNEEDCTPVPVPDDDKAKSEFSNLFDEVLYNSCDVDALNYPFSSNIYEHTEPLCIESNRTTSEYSCTTEELGTSKDAITNVQCSPDLSSIFREIENLLDIKETDAELENNSYMIGDSKDDSLVNIVPIQEADGDLASSDFLWDMDLWSTL